MVAVLLSLVREGEQLMPFLKTIANSKSFFGAASRAFRLNPSGNMHNQIMKLPDLQVIEALSMVLERLSRLSSKSSYTMFIQGTQKCGGWWRVVAGCELQSHFFLLLSLLSFALSYSLLLLSPFSAGLVPTLKEWSRVLSNEAGDGANFLVMNANAIVKRVATKRSGQQGSDNAGLDSSNNHPQLGRGRGGKATARRNQERQFKEAQSPSRHAVLDTMDAMDAMDAMDTKRDSGASASPPRNRNNRRYNNDDDDDDRNVRRSGGSTHDQEEGKRNGETQVSEVPFDVNERSPWSQQFDREYNQQYDDDDEELAPNELEEIESELYGQHRNGNSPARNQRNSRNSRPSPVRNSPVRNSPVRNSPQRQQEQDQVSPPGTDDGDRSASRSPVPQIYDNVADAEQYLVKQAMKKSPAVRAVAQTNDMSSTAVQSPERSTDDLLAFYNRLISKARALHEDENDMDQDEEDTLFDEFQHQMEDEKFGAKSL